MRGHPTADDNRALELLRHVSSSSKTCLQRQENLIMNTADDHITPLFAPQRHLLNARRLNDVTLLGLSAKKI